MVTRVLHRRRLSTALVVAAVIVLLGVALSPRYASWYFQLRVSEGLPRDVVIGRIGHDYTLFTKDNYDELRARLLNYTPTVDFGRADSIMVYALGLDRLGIVLVSVDGNVLGRFVVRT